MNAWKYVGTGISRIKKFYNGGKHIFIWIDDWSEICSVWESGADNQTDGHSCKKHGAQSVIFFYIMKEKVTDGNRDIGKPQQVWNDEVFIKRNEIINGYVHDMIMAGYRFFLSKKTMEYRQRHN